MTTYDLTEAARRIGVDVSDLGRYVDLGMISPDDGRFTPGHLRRAGLVKSLVDSGIPLDGLGTAIRTGRISLDFLDAPAFERFSALSGDTFAGVAERTGVPVEQLLYVREAAGSVAPAPDDRIRDEELPYAAMLEAAVGASFRPSVIHQMIRVHGDSLRRLAETEAEMWQSEVVRPAIDAGKRPDEILGADFGNRMSVLTERSVVAMYHLQQTRAWTSNIIENLEIALADAGLHSRLEHPPAMCFFDISGYTRLTQEFGDAAAANVADKLGTVVQRTSVRYGGRPVKWLGDGVMLHFPNPGRGVEAAIEMVSGCVDAGLPPAHVGLHAGPVIFQEGDYYGSTVNLASRIADYAQAGEVMVSQAVVDASGGSVAAFRAVGPVELKGVSAAMDLFAASLPGLTRVDDMQVCDHLGVADQVETPLGVCSSCVEIGAHWAHLRQCLTCGRTSCCNLSPNRHATAHFQETGHPMIRSAEPGEDWRWCYVDDRLYMAETPGDATMEA